MKRALATMLNYSEACFREYRRGDKSFSVYVAYWKPGQFHPRMIFSHTPDNCWTGAGWRLMENGGSRPLRCADGWKSIPGESRIFETAGTRQHVIYWHVVGGRRSIYFERRRTQLELFFETFWSDISRGQNEQYFIRLAANVPWDQLAGDPLFDAVLRSLGTLGLNEA
jgi:hypothetical protein